MLLDYLFCPKLNNISAYCYVQQQARSVDSLPIVKRRRVEEMPLFCLVLHRFSYEVGLSVLILIDVNKTSVYC